MKQRRRNGEGWVEKHGETFRARRWGDDGRKETIASGLESREEAEGVLAVFMEGLAAESPVAGESLASWSRKWLDARELDGVHRSVTRDRHAFKRVSKEPIAELPLAAVTPRDVRDWLAAQVKTGAAKQTIANALNLLRVCLESACEQGKLERNPALGVKVPRIASTKEKWTWLRAAELEKLLAGDSEERDIYAVAVYTGLRAGELFGLEWPDVDLEHGVASIRHSWQGTATKRGEARRVSLLEPAIEALRRQHTRSKDRRNVFPARDGEARTKDQMPDLGAALRAVGIDRHVRFHDLRHTCASHLIQGSWAPHLVARSMRLEEVQVWLGHTSPATTARYAHLCPEAVAGLVVRTPPALPPNAPKKVLRLVVTKARKTL
jgi:integrase